VETELIQGLRVNRHAIVLIDSDKRNSKAPLKDRARKAADAVHGVGGRAWITEGREVENYIPREIWTALQVGAGATVVQFPKRFDDVFKYAEKQQMGKFRTRKHALARLVAPRITWEGIDRTLDLAKQVNAACELICKWNGLDPVVFRAH
jgi:hypothetical protein